MDNNDNNKDERTLLSEDERALVDLVSRGFSDDEITAQLQIPKERVLHGIAGLLAKIGAQERLEIVFYACAAAGMYKRMGTEVKKDFDLPAMKAT
jgi:DNA-binding NarL/FixJ family response regulator